MMNKALCKAFKKEISKLLISSIWHPIKWWDWCMSEVEKNKIDPIFTDKN